MNKNTITMIVVGLVFAGGGFFGGMKYAQSKTPFYMRGIAGAAGTFAGRGGGRGGAGFTGGQIIAKDAQSITVSVQGGGSKIVFLTSSTTVMKASSGTVNDLTVGDTVTATGSTNSDGSVTAQTIQIRPAMTTGR